VEIFRKAIGIFPIEYKSILLIRLRKETWSLLKGLLTNVRNGWKFAKWHKSSHTGDGSPDAAERKKVNKREKWVIWSAAGGDERTGERLALHLPRAPPSMHKCLRTLHIYIYCRCD
jgi:hypothetical protein